MARSPRHRLVAGCAALVVLAAACSVAAGVESERADRAGRPPSTDPQETEPTAETLPVLTRPDITFDETVPTEPTDPTVTTPPDDDPFDWQEIDDGLEFGRLHVPVDYDDPDGPQFSLFLARRLADEPENRIGSLLVNPGGPGFPGTDLVEFAEQFYSEELLERFDIIAWDPRGVGRSTPAIDCIDDYDRYAGEPDITPDDELESQLLVDLAEELTAACLDANADIFDHVGTNDSARDIDTIRRALGEETISYFGFSYGSTLGATWATLFPETVRAAVLDGARDPTSTLAEATLQQAAGFERTLATFLAQCSEDDECAFHSDGDAEGAFDALMLELDADPVPTEDGRPEANLAVARQAVAGALYREAYWPTLAESLAAAQDGDGDGLLALYDAYYQYRGDGEWGNEFEAFVTILCMDYAERFTVEEEDAATAAIHEVAPRFVPFTSGSYECTFFPPSTDPRAEVTGAGAGPIVVVGTTGDAATPIESSRAMADALEDGRFIAVTANRHTGYGVASCGDDLVDRYLVDLEVPPEESNC